MTQVINPTCWATREKSWPWGRDGETIKNWEHVFPLLERLLEVLFSLLFGIFCSFEATVCRNRSILVCGESLQHNSSSGSMTLPSLEAHFHRNESLSGHMALLLLSYIFPITVVSPAVLSLLEQSALTMGSEVIKGLPTASLLHHCPGLWSFLLLFFFLPTGKSLFIKPKLHRTLKWRSAPALTAIPTKMARLLQTPRRGSLNAQQWFSGRCSKEKRDRLQHRRTSGTDSLKEVIAELRKRGLKTDTWPGRIRLCSVG